MDEPKLVETWEELAKCTSETHKLEIDLRLGGGYIISKNVNNKDYHKNNFCLSTHTFYGGQYKQSTEKLQKCGFNVVLANWDE